MGAMSSILAPLGRFGRLSASRAAHGAGCTDCAPRGSKITTSKTT
jgi:hypothetical protein